MSLANLSSIVVFTPLLGGVITGLFRKPLGHKGAHRVAILSIAIAFLAALSLYKSLFNHEAIQTIIYTWAASDNLRLNIGFLLDPLSTLLMVVVTFISLLVHIYSIGYMKDDSGYQRFFSYISLFTFAMLMLISANNFLQLFFGWESVGLVSYLLIGFWFKRESANQGSLKAFLVNRVGDLGFLIGIAGILSYFGSLDYFTVFSQIPSFADTLAQGASHHAAILNLLGILLLIGAMGKSAQVPLHIWLPESMEGPTPISALIHAATMVTAGIYMVCRMSPLYEYAPHALSAILIIGATGAFFLGLLAIVQTDIKRVVAYSTLSQLGYMMAALGASAYAAGIFHLVTHACFKALLFLGSGSVILAMHHNQDLRHMGNLRQYMPITYLTFLLAALSLSAIPPFAGFYSKDAIIEAIGLSKLYGAHYAYCCVLFGSFVTALYTFRAFFLAFHGKERMDNHVRQHLRESPWVVTLPLIILAIPSVILGGLLVEAILYQGLLGRHILILPQHNVLGEMAQKFSNRWQQAFFAWQHLPFWLALSGIVTAWFCYLYRPTLPNQLAQRFGIFYRVLLNKYGFDGFNDYVLVRGARSLGLWLFQIGDIQAIDGLCVNGSGRTITRLSSIMRLAQSGYLYHYALVMVISVLALLVWILF